MEKRIKGDSTGGIVSEFIGDRLGFRSNLRYRPSINKDKKLLATQRVISLDNLLGQVKQSPTQYYRRQIIAKNLLESKVAREASKFGKPSYIGIQDQEAEWEKRKAELRRAQRAKFDEMMASPISLNNTSATYDDILKGREEQSQREYKQLRDFYAKTESEQTEKKEKKKKIGELYRKDMLSDFDSRMEELTERYGGDRSKAEDKYKKELNQNLPLFFRNSKMSAKQLHNLTRGFGFLKSAGAAGVSVATAGIALTKGITKAADAGNARVVGMENLLNLYGKPSKDELNAGLLAGMKPEDVVKIRGQMLTKFGGMAPLKMIAKNVSSLDDIGRVAVAEQLGLDANMMAFLDILAQTGRIESTEHRQTNAKTELAKYAEAGMLKSGSGVLNTIAGYFGDASVGARFVDDLKVKGDKAKEISEQSSSLPSQERVAPEASPSNAGAQVSFNIGTVDVNADNPEQLVYELGAVASSHSNNHTLAVAFDSGLKA